MRGLQAFWFRARAGRARRRVERATRTELGALDARVLRDLGLTRSEIPSVAAEVAGPGGLTARRTRRSPG